MVWLANTGVRMVSKSDRLAAAEGSVSEAPSATARPEMQESSATVVATRLKLRNWLKLWRFFRLNGAVARQLKADPSLISYALRADFIRLRFSTLSVWTDDPAIEAFVRTGGHRDALTLFDDVAVREQSVFVRWQTTHPQDVTWKEARQRLSAVRLST